MSSDGPGTGGPDETPATPEPAVEDSRTAVPKSAAAAAARRARRIAGPANTRQPARPPRREPVTPAEPDAAEPAAEPVTEAPSGPVVEPEADTVGIPLEPPDDLADTIRVRVPPPASAAAPAFARWLPAVVLVAAAVAMAVLIATFSHSVWWAKPSSATGQHVPTKAKSKGDVASTDGSVNVLREQVLAAAKQCVIATNQYSYTTLDADEAAGAKCTTGVQTARYKAAMDNLIRKTAIKLKASQVPKINDAGIESVTADGKQWAIVVYGQLAIHNVNVKSRTDPFAADVRMDYVHGKWLMSDVQTLSEPSS